MAVGWAHFIAMDLFVGGGETLNPGPWTLDPGP
jgi:hypothetical protein